MASTYLVTGGAGFLGFNLNKRLLESGNKVICLDNMRSGQLRHVSELSTYTHFKFIEHDVRNVFPDSSINGDVDAVINFACPASPPWYQADPIGTMMTSVQGVFNGLNWALKYSVPFLQASTSEVYGDPQVNPQTENYWGNVNPVGPRSCYDEGKRAAESLTNDFATSHGMRNGIMRIFNTYGPGMRADDGRVVSNFITQALSGRNLTVHGDGSQTRSFCYVEDLITGVIRFADLLSNTSPGVLTGPINIGNPNPISMRTLAELIIEMTSSRSIIEFQARPVDDPNLRMPNTKLAQELLKWHPEVGIELGLSKTIEFFRGHK